MNLKVIKAAERFKANRVDKAEKLCIKKDLKVFGPDLNAVGKKIVRYPVDVLNDKDIVKAGESQGEDVFIFSDEAMDKLNDLLGKEPGSKIEMTLKEFLNGGYLSENDLDKIMDEIISREEEFIVKPALTQEEIDAFMEPDGHYMAPYDQSQESTEPTICEFLTEAAYEALRAAHETGDQKIIDRVWGDISSGKYYYDNEEWNRRKTENDSAVVTQDENEIIKIINYFFGTE